MRHSYRLLFLIITIIILTYNLPILAQSCDATTGTTERQSYHSTIAQTTMYYTVYLPPCYDPNNTYPVVYLMHGSASYDDHWLQIGLDDALDEAIAAGDAPAMIAILPFGEWIANENQFERVSFENVFLEELLPDVESRYAVDQSGNQRAIGGISRGGFWAYLIGLRHPQMFTAIGGHSAFFDPYHAPPTHNPLNLAADAEGIDTLALSIDRGADDYAAPGLEAMDTALSQRGIDYIYTVHPSGEHNNNYWSAHISEYVAFYAENLSDAPSTPQLPDPASFTFNPPIPTPDPSQFRFTPPVQEAAANAVELYLPVVAFNSTRYDITAGEIWDLTAGGTNNNFVLNEETAAALDALGINVNPARVLTSQELEQRLWNDRTKFTLLPFDALTPRYRILTVDGTNPLFDLSAYPMAYPSDAPNFDPSRLTTITLSGVTAMTRRSIPPIDRNGVEWVTSGIAPYTTRVDFFHTSNEVSFTDTCPVRTGGELGAFCSKSDHFAVFDAVGLDIVELSGNHNNDFGYDAYQNTLDRLHENGFQTIGGGASVLEAQAPAILFHNGNTIAMFACNDAGPYYAVVGEDRPGAAACGPWLEDAIADASQIADTVVVTVQHVEFEEYLPRPEIQADFRQLADWGADIVAGTHAHKPQSFEFYANNRGTTTFIHYGLGNLFFDQPFWGNSRFWMDTLFIYDGKLATVELFTGIIEDEARPRPMTPEERQNFLDFMFVVNNGVQ